MQCIASSPQSCGRKRGFLNIAGGRGWVGATLCSIWAQNQLPCGFSKCIPIEVFFRGTGVCTVLCVTQTWPLLTAATKPEV